jgi:hypothetical protein
MTIMIENKAEFVAFVEEAIISGLAKQQKAVNPEKLYTRSQAARLMGKTYNTIDRMILQKRITATADGKYISQRAIDNYLNGQK